MKALTSSFLLDWTLELLLLCRTVEDGDGVEVSAFNIPVLELGRLSLPALLAEEEEDGLLRPGVTILLACRLPPPAVAVGTANLPLLAGVSRDEDSFLGVSSPLAFLLPDFRHSERCSPGEMPLAAVVDGVVAAAAPTDNWRESVAVLVSKTASSTEVLERLSSGLGLPLCSSKSSTSFRKLSSAKRNFVRKTFSVKTCLKITKPQSKCRIQTGEDGKRRID